MYQIPTAKSLMSSQASPASPMANTQTCDLNAKPTSTSDRINKANGLSHSRFYSIYVEPALRLLSDDSAEIAFQSSSNISCDDFVACLDLIQTTSAAAYSASTKGWSRKEKEREMRDPRMRYLLLRDSSGLLGFIEFMLDREDTFEVIYCYEIHTREDARGIGHGAKLMKLMEDIGRAVGVEKSMLTVFTSNGAAIRLYERIGYGLYDEEPVPASKRLRSGLKDKPRPSYIIMAKNL